jgi:hypothetical protein
MFTRREILTAAAYGDADHWPTHAELAKRWGIGRTAVTMRLKRFMQKLSPEQAAEFRRRTRCGYRRALAAGGKLPKMIPMQLSLAVGV